ncbi:MAG: 4-alpha-glucanotransferase [Candidatus Nanopelagicales bacterium]
MSEPDDLTVYDTVDDRLAALADAYGVATEYVDHGKMLRHVSAATVRGVLTALGVSAQSTEQVEQSLSQRRLEPWRRTLPPVLVLRQGADIAVPVHVPHGTGVRVAVELEGGGTSDLTQVVNRTAPVSVDGALVVAASFRVPSNLPTGWHVLHAVTASGEHATCPLVITPQRLTPPGPFASSRGWGFALQLYALRSRSSWGLGDLGDLCRLATWSGRDLGADFVLINPVHAAAPGPPRERSPYLPATRRFADPLYLHVEAIAEYASLSDADRAEMEALREPVRAADLTADLLDRDAAWAAKSTALQWIYHVPRSARREAAFQAYVAAQGQGLEDFATWCALAEAYGPPSGWPDRLGDPCGDAVSGERSRLADVIDLHRWYQWLLDEQLAQTQQAAREAGMGLGVLHDLAVGVHPDGADAWALREVLAAGVSVGAPPDDYNRNGQDWSQPPWRPDGLGEKGFLPYRDMLRTVLRHAGGIRVDHVMGLFRLWWIPEGLPPSQGTYVRYDHEAMLGILVLEAERAGAVVIGEDLGTVEPWVREVLAARGVLGTSVLWFERDEAGAPRSPEHWRRDALAAVTTHDLPPTAGYLDGEHVRVRSSLGLLASSHDAEQTGHEAERTAWLTVLHRRGLLATEESDEQKIIEALHRFLLLTPSRLVAVALADAVGDRHAQNQPGTSAEYPNWCVPLTDFRGAPVLLDDLPTNPRLLSLARLMAAD